MIFENSSLKGIFGQNMSYPPKWTGDSRFLQGAVLKNIGARVSQVDTRKDGPCPME